jgi:hypothetical protein
MGPDVMRFYWLVLGILSVWRITHLLTAEDGPWESVVRFRRFLGHGFWGKLLDCFLCLSLWVAAPVAWMIGEGLGERLLLWPALSAGAILLERRTARPGAAQYWEDPPHSDEDE